MGCLEAAPCLFCARELSIEPNVERGRIRIHYRSLSVIIAMPRGRTLSDDARRIIVRLCESLPLQEVVDQSGIPRRTVERILAEYKERGTVDRVKAPPRALGAPRILSRENVQVCALPDNMILPFHSPFSSFWKGRFGTHLMHTSTSCERLCGPGQARTFQQRRSGVLCTGVDLP